MADTAIANFTAGSTAQATDRIAGVRSPFAAGDDRYFTPVDLWNYGGVGFPDPYQDAGGANWICPLAMTTTTLVVTADRLYKVPIIFRKAGTITAVGIRLTATSAGNARIGIRRYANGVATTLLTGGDLGTADTGSGTEKTITSLSVAIPQPGLYVAEVVFSATPTILATNAIVPTLGATLGGTPTSHLYRAFSYAALPADETAQAQTVAGNAAPWICFKTW